VAVSIELVKELRERTGAGIKECKDILEQVDGNINKAIEILRERGIEAAAKKSTREAKEGLIGVLCPLRRPRGRPGGAELRDRLCGPH